MELISRMRREYFPSVEEIKVDGERVEPPAEIPWYPNGLAFQYQASRQEMRKSEALARLHSFLVSETETGNISRQEAVSMVPPLLLDVKPHHAILDMCAAPGSKTTQILELMHNALNDGEIPGTLYKSSFSICQPLRLSMATIIST